MKRAILAAGVCLLAPVFGAKLDPVQWNLNSDQAKAAPGSSVTLKLTAQLQTGWHLYSLTTPAGGPIPTTVKLTDNPAIDSFKLYQPKPERKFDPNFNLDTETFENQVVFWITANLKKDAPAGSADLTAEVRYQSCNDKVCLPPKTKTASFTLAVDPSAAAAAAFVVPAGYALIGPVAPAAPDKSVTTVQATSDNIWAFLLTAFGFGLATIFTPCVFPMIPMTVSFFLNQRGGIGQALVFSLGIIVLFCALGFGVAAAVGPFGVVQLASNPWVNGFIALVFGVFALSLLGAFEITLPSSMLTKLDSASRRGGYFGTLLMGVTFTLTSFACIGPFLGTILFASVQQKGAQPVLGMASFATGLALPFFFLAAFPSYLKKLPKSGGWLARVKVVMGFAVLAFMLKYLSNVDLVLQTNWLTRERFLAAWFVLSAMAGLYLLGLLHLEGVEPGEHLGVARLLTASAILIFAFSLLPGMFGAPLGDLDAFVPPPAANEAGAQAQAGQIWMKNQYREALSLAKQQNKHVLVAFTGYACTNCHWMKANMWPRPEIADAMKDLVLVELYTDGTDKESAEFQKLEEDRFQTTAIPYYAIMDADGKVIARLEGRSTDEKQVLQFVKSRG
ncbi:MAG TPA: protein-disulfide reductase DsbD domain-containing protein [Bryobacteraceae bacterium]|nr:protein-disulfide reductase DsbD domain-containing protein [Bryobacteraceae bacterium]